jgi:hypothetical protein
MPPQTQSDKNARTGGLSNAGVYQGLRLWDERTRSADPLLAKHGAGDSLTSGSASSAGHEHDSGRSRDAKFSNRSLTRYTSGTRRYMALGLERSARFGPAILRILASTECGSAFGR